MTSQPGSNPPKSGQPEWDPDTAAVLFDFVQHYLDDQTSGQVKPIEFYESHYPAPEGAIRAEYEGLQDSKQKQGDDAQKVGHYRLLRELGRGGQGSVWLAEDEALRRPVALKLLNSWLIGGDRLARFRREAESIAKLEHEGLAVVFEADVESAQPYIAMRFVEGEDLASCLAKKNSPDKPTFCEPQSALGMRATLHFFERAARALHAAHEAGVVHRDIKPSNIMVTANNQPVITDFGLALDEFTPGEETITREGEIFGTPAYMSPEQVEGRSEDIDRRTDVWSLGATLFETLTGRAPFQGKGQIGLARAILGDPLPNPRQFPNGKHIPGDVAVVLQTAMERDPARRYSSALALAEDLRRIREFEPIRARPQSTWLRLRRWCRREPAWATALTLIFLGLVTGLIASQIMVGRIARSLDKERSMRVVRQVPSLQNKSPSLALAVGLHAVELDDSWLSRSSLFGPLEALSMTARAKFPTQYRVWDAGFMQDGKRAFGAGEHGVCLYSIEDGATLAQRIFPEMEEVGVRECVEIAEIDSLLAGRDTGQVHCLNSKDLQELWVRDFPSAVQSLTRHPKLAQALVLTLDHGAFVLDATNGEILMEIPVPEHSASMMRYSPQGDRILSYPRAFRGKPVIKTTQALLWDGKSGALVARLGHTGLVRDGSFNPKTGQLSTVTAKGELRQWNPQNGQRLEPIENLGFERTGPLERVVYAPHGLGLAIAGLRGVWFWDSVSGSWQAMQDSQDKNRDLAFDPTGTKLAGSALDNAIRVWEVEDGSKVREHRAQRRPMLLEWSANGKGLLSAGIGSSIFFWSQVPNAEAWRYLGGGEPIVWAGFVPGAERAIVADALGKLVLIETPLHNGGTTPGEQVAVLAQHGPGEIRCAIAANAPIAVSAGSTGRVVLHDLPAASQAGFQMGNQTTSPTELPRGIRDLAISPNGTHVAFVDGLGLLHLWDVQAQTSTRPIGVAPGIRKVAFDDQGRYLAAGDSLGSVQAWAIDGGPAILNGKPVWPDETTERHPVVDLSFSSDGSLLYAASSKWSLHTWKVQPQPQEEKREVRMWHRWLKPIPTGGAITVGVGRGSFDIGKKEEGVRPQTLHTKSLTAVGINPSGRWFATGSEDNHVLVWDWRTGKTQCRFDLHTAPIRWVAFSPVEGDTRILSASDDGTVALWHMNPVSAAKALAPHGLTSTELEGL